MWKDSVQTSSKIGTSQCKLPAKMQFFYWKKKKKTKTSAEIRTQTGPKATNIFCFRFFFPFVPLGEIEIPSGGWRLFAFLKKSSKHIFKNNSIARSTKLQLQIKEFCLWIPAWESVFPDISNLGAQIYKSAFEEERSDFMQVLSREKDNRNEEQNNDFAIYLRLPPSLLQGSNTNNRGLREARFSSIRCLFKFNASFMVMLW